MDTMLDEIPTTLTYPAGTSRAAGTVTDLTTRRRRDDVLSTITLVFDGIHFGTFSISAPYTRGKPIMLYLVRQAEDSGGEDIAGPIDCLLTDDATLSADLDVAR
jgi:hypothetical protein